VRRDAEQDELVRHRRDGTARDERRHLGAHDLLVRVRVRSRVRVRVRVKVRVRVRVRTIASNLLIEPKRISICSCTTCRSDSTAQLRLATAKVLSCRCSSS